MTTDNTFTTKQTLERIPKTFNCGGQQFAVIGVDRLDDNCLGECRGGECVVAIANKYNRDTIIIKITDDD